jgi:glycosyltransferase involved in cell wall biosynthesis
MEAMACGTPVIGTRVGGIPDLISHGTNGYLVEPDDALEMLELIQTLIANPSTLARLSENAQRVAHENWDWGTIIRSFREAVLVRLPKPAGTPVTLIEEGT